MSCESLSISVRYFFAARFLCPLPPCGARAVPSAVAGGAWPGHHGCGSQRRAEEEEGEVSNREKMGRNGDPPPPVGAGGRPQTESETLLTCLRHGRGAGSPRSLLTGRRRVAQSRCQACARLPWRRPQNVPDVQVIRRQRAVRPCC